MANEIKLITFADSEVSATDDAYVYETATGDGGVINGCAVTIKNASQLHITGGNGILCGRKFTVYDSDINVTLSSSGTLLGRLYIHMDLSNASTPIQLMVETGASLTPVVQDADVNATNGIFEVNLATFNVSTSTISDLADVAPKASPINVLSTVAECVASTNPGDVAGASALSELNSNLKKIHILTGTMPAYGVSATINYPTGLNVNNCMVLQALFEASTSNWYFFEDSGVGYATQIQQASYITIASLRNESANKPYRIALVEL